MALIQLLDFNNYRNRQYKELPENVTPIRSISKVNFNPNDGVNTTLVVSVFDDENINQINYCVVRTEDLATSEIASKWFVLDAQRLQTFEYELTLRRDLLAEYFDSIINAPVFIEKATIKATNPLNPLLFNSEDMTFNQIKTKEIKLTDNTKCPWIIGYISKNSAPVQRDFKIPKEATSKFLTYSSWEAFPFYDAVTSGEFKAPATRVTFQINSDMGTKTLGSTLRISTDNTYTQAFTANVEGKVHLLAEPRPETWALARDRFLTFYESDSSLKRVVQQGLSDAVKEESFLSTFPPGSINVRIGNSTEGYKHYQLTRSVEQSVTETIIPDTTSLGYQRIKTGVEGTGLFDVPTNSTTNFSYARTYKVYNVSFREIPNTEEYYVSIPIDGKRASLEHDPYDMFAIPYGAPIAVDSHFTYTTFEKELALRAANTIAEGLGGLGNNLIFDLQLLPYCPMPEIVNTDGSLDISQLQALQDYIFVNDGSDTGDMKQIIFFPRKSSFSLSITKGIVGKEQVSIKVGITEPKVQALCDTYRLVSPNYNGQFEFNAAKNGGIAYFEIDCTYKPFNPYIHIAPNFGGLYGNNFDDARGLICGGDFSLPTITDQWISYEINNKNYQNSFNRQIENMEINNSYARESEKIAAIAGTVQGVVSGIGTGGMVGGSIGTMFGKAGVGTAIGSAIGGAVSGLASGLAGVKDLQINDALRAEALDFAVDQFGYTLGNIKALPYSLNRVSALNANNKLFPILEYYTCSDIEKEALRNKIKYNGMTVMTIGAIADYIIENESSYIKGKLIRLEGVDNHTATEIAYELDKGFYI